MSRRSTWLGLLGVALLAAPAARADSPPSVWDIARDPGMRDRWELHVRVERLLSAPRAAGVPMLDDELRLEAARALLDDADAAHSPDLRLRFDLGVVYEQLATVQHRNDLHRRVIEVLAPAVQQAGDDPGANAALAALVYAYAKLDRPREELATWRRYIPRLLDERSRVAPLMNMGEAEMRLGLLDDALATFRQGLALCERLPNSIAVNSTYALTLWDLAVVLDRSGDPTTALQTAAKARSWMIGGPTQSGRITTGWDIIRDDREVFFVPDWEREWYLALGEASSAEGAADPRDEARDWANAEAHWDVYIMRASEAGAHDRWLAIARSRRERVHAARLRAEQRAAKLPVRPSTHQSL